MAALQDTWAARPPNVYKAHARLLCLLSTSWICVGLVINGPQIVMAVITSHHITSHHITSQLITKHHITSHQAVAGVAGEAGIVRAMVAAQPSTAELKDRQGLTPAQILHLRTGQVRVKVLDQGSGLRV